MGRVYCSRLCILKYVQRTNWLRFRVWVQHLSPLVLVRYLNGGSLDISDGIIVQNSPTHYQMMRVLGLQALNHNSVSISYHSN